MRVFVFALYSTVESSFGTDLEIIQTHLNKGDQVTVFTCKGEFTSCDRNRENEKSKCQLCIQRSQRGLSLLHNTENLEIHDLGKNQNLFKEYSDFIMGSSLNQKVLKDYYYNNFDIGYAALSSLISWKRNANPDLQDDNIKSFLKNIGVSSLRLYSEADRIIKTKNPDLIYVFNGRYALMRSVVRAAELNNVNYFTHDRNYKDLLGYGLFKNSLPHSKSLFDKEMFGAWKDAPAESRSLIAKDWFTNKREGAAGSWKSFIQNQRDDLLPTNWDEDKINICVFTSSEDEMAAVGKEWEDRLFPNQLAGIRFLKSIMEDASDKPIRLYIRMHPNQENDKDLLNQLKQLENNSIFIINPISAVSTYALIDNCNKVITFGSSVGIEAVFWGKPSILLGQCFYESLEATYNPKKIDQIDQLFFDEELKAKPKELSYPYGYRMATFGETYKYYSATGLFTGLFNNQSMAPLQGSMNRKKIKSVFKKLNDLLTSRK